MTVSPRTQKAPRGVFEEGRRILLGLSYFWRHHISVPKRAASNIILYVSLGKNTGYSELAVDSGVLGHDFQALEYHFFLVLRVKNH